jgi:hypothetical protein
MCDLPIDVRLTTRSAACLGISSWHLVRQAIEPFGQHCAFDGRHLYVRAVSQRFPQRHRESGHLR